VAIEENKDTVYTSESKGSESKEFVKSAIKKGSATGKRKEAIARVRMIPGKGNYLINGKTLKEYFPNKVHQQIINTPLELCNLAGKFDIIAKVTGGGNSGQAGAMRLGIARSLNEIDREANRPTLKKSGMLTRDDRIVERKKAGLKKARKASQFSKR
jgi:small subunit ribosomal protein S9